MVHRSQREGGSERLFNFSPRHRDTMAGMFPGQHLKSITAQQQAHTDTHTLIHIVLYTMDREVGRLVDLNVINSS